MNNRPNKAEVERENGMAGDSRLDESPATSPIVGQPSHNLTLPFVFRILDKLCLLSEFATYRSLGPVRRFRELLDARIYSHIEDSFRGFQPTPTRSVEEVHHRDVTFADIRRFLHEGRPVVVREFGSEMEAVRTWSPDWFDQHFGHIRFPAVLHNRYQETTEDIGVSAHGKIRNTQEETTVSDIINDMYCETERSKRLYAMFESAVFEEHPELLDSIDMQTMLEIARPWNPINSQLLVKLFMGGKGTGTNWHNAPMHNLFLQIYGEKTWELCSGEERHALHASLDVSVPYYVSPVSSTNPDHEKFPNYKYIKRQGTTLRAGDLLVLPQFWFHSVVNPGPSIGCSMWWCPILANLKKDLLWSMCFYFRPRMLFYEIPKTLLNGRRMYNDSVSVRRLYDSRGH